MWCRKGQPYPNYPQNYCTRYSQYTTTLVLLTKLFLPLIKDIQLAYGFHTSQVITNNRLPKLYSKLPRQKVTLIEISKSVEEKIKPTSNQ